MGRTAPRLVSFLGASDYEDVAYELDGRTAATTPFVARALAELFGPREIVILATETAEQKNGTALHRALLEAGFPEPRFVRVPEGRSRDELAELFRVLRREFAGTREPVVLDITHGFRTQPFFAASVLAFSRAVDDPPPEVRVVYGAFEQRSGDGKAPIRDLSYLVEVLDWAQALRLFLRTGRATEAAAATERVGRELGKAWAEGEKKGAQPRLQALGKALRQFGDDLETLRTGDLLLGRDGGTKRRASARELVQALEAARAEVDEHLPPLAQVLDRVEAMVRPLVGEFRDLKAGQGRAAVGALADLYFRRGRYLEAIATVREGLVNERAPVAATRPAAADFDAAARAATEKELGSDLVFKAAADLRNDLLHAQYRQGDGARPARSIVAQVEKAVGDFVGRNGGAGSSS
jgi:CRISPR-associated protein Csx16